MTDSNVSRRDSLRNLAALGMAGAAVALGGTALSATSAEAAQPLMANALRDLQAARGLLQHALADKGGHRVKAIALVDEAIAEVKAGMAAGAM
ncbi:MAG TPA: hypothetical protein VHB23_09760 [Devosiaceae bacterium]|jgi:hypothetical protein|nr:hypothetical protein [Devosiaceae bacterium]